MPVAILEQTIRQMAPAIDWSDGELSAWQPSERCTPAQWAERHRILQREQSARPGPLRHANAPYLAGLCDLCDVPHVREVWIQKAAQIGVSEAMRSVLGYWAHIDPDPVLIVLPDEKKGREVVADRIIPLFNSTPVLRELHTGIKRDIKLSEIALTNGFKLRLGFSGSPSALATHPARRVVFDEVDKFVPFSGRESDPVSLGRQRTKTFEHRRVIVCLSTPTTADGLIYTGRQSASVQLRYYVPCPHCGVWQTLDFARVRWPAANETETKEQHADRVAATKSAWYVCESCEAEIYERHKPGMVRAGVWAVSSEAAQRTRATDIDSTISLEDWPIGDSVGVQIPELYCLWVPWYETAAAFLRADGDVAKLMDFRNSRLGEPAQEQIVRVKPSVFADKSMIGYEPGVLPNWAQRVLASIDVQLDHVYVVVRAWGYGLQSRRIWHARIDFPKDSATGWNELHRSIFEPVYQFEDSTRGGLRVDLAVIDAKYRTDEAYRFSLRDSRIKAVNGVDKELSQYVIAKPHEYQPPATKRRVRVWLHLMDTARLKDWLAGAITSKIAHADSETGELIEHDLWQLNRTNDPDYNRQMASEHKVLRRKGAAHPREIWEKLTDNADNHYWDCEYMQRAAAYMARVDVLPDIARTELAEVTQRPDGPNRPRWKIGR